MAISTAYITDNGCDLSHEYLARRGLAQMYLICMLGDVQVDQSDDRNGLHDFYEQMRAGASGSTAQINTHTFIEFFEPYLKNGDDVFYIGFSSALSATFQSALLAKEDLEARYPARKVYVVDSKQASMGQGLLVHYALNMRDEGQADQAIYDWLMQNRPYFAAWFTVDDLAYLRRGGRVSGAAAAIGTLLDIKPILHIDDQGRLVPADKVRGRARSLQALVDHMKKTALDPIHSKVFISHGDNLADAEKLADMVRKQLGATDIDIGEIGPTIGTHSGPDTIALFFTCTQR